MLVIQQNLSDLTKEGKKYALGFHNPYKTSSNS